MPVRSFTDTQGRRRYAVEFESKGHRFFRRLPPGATKEQAGKLETRLKHELIDQAVVGERPNVSIKAAIEGWLGEVVRGRKSDSQTGSHAAIVIGQVGDHLVGSIAGEAAEIIRGSTTSTASETRALAPGTINRRLCILKAVAKFAWRKGWTAENLSSRIQLLPEPKYHRRAVTAEQARSLIDHAPNPRAKALIALSAYTGLRLGEVLKLQPEDVKGGVIVARDTKNGTDRIIPILPELKPHLKQLPFTAGWRNVYRGFESARRRAGLEIRYHDLRHLVASLLAGSGSDARLSMKLMGHKSHATHLRYVHPELGPMKKMLAKALRPITRPIGKRTKTKGAA